jgi:hypothetical protein
MVVLTAFFAEDKYLTEVANLCFIVAILMLCVLPIGLGVAGLKAAQKSNKKEFQYFICHHKQGAGARARLLKIRLKGTAGVKRKVFIDSGDLKDLTKLQDCVANDTESLALLHTAGVLYRPWCVLEIATAKYMRLQLCRVDFPEVQQMSKETIDTYDTHVQDVTVLAEYGFDLDYVKGAWRWRLAFNGIRCGESERSVTLRIVLPWLCGCLPTLAG